MAFEKGHKKIGGRKKGTQNKITHELRERVNLLIDNNWDSTFQDFNKLDIKTRIDTLIKLLEFALPKLNKIDINISPRIDDLLNMSEDERLSRIRELNAKIENDR